MRHQKSVVYCILVLVIAGCNRLQIAGTDGQGNSSETIARGNLRTEDGGAASGVVVNLLPSTFDPVSGNAPDSLSQTTTDQDGWYEFLHVKPGSYSVESIDTLRHSGVAVRTIAVTDTAKVVSIGVSFLSKTATVSVAFARMKLSRGDYVYIPGSSSFAVIDSLSAASSTVLLRDVSAGLYPAMTYVRLADSLRSNILDAPLILAAGDSKTISVDAYLSKYSKRLFFNTTSSGANINENVYNFPILVRLTVNNFNFAQATLSGSDVRFVKADNTPLSFEVSRWDAGAAQAEIWVKVDTIFGNDSTHFITMYWGNAGATVASSGGVVFDTANGFQGVWHLDEATGTTAYDATINHYDGIPSDTAPTNASGIVGNAQQFDGVSSCIQMKNTASSKLNFIENGNFSISAWVNTDTVDSAFHVIVAKGHEQYVLKLKSISKVWEFVNWQDNVGDNMSQFGPPLAKTWNYLVAIRNENQQYLYLNGNLVSSTFTIHSKPLPRDTTNDVSIGKFLNFVPGPGNEGYASFGGKIDEVRISNNVVSADWIRLCYMNQRADDRLVTFK